MSVLDSIVERKSSEVDRLRSTFNLAEARAQVAALSPCADFIGVFDDSTKVPIIAEIKRRSPSRGVLVEALDVTERARMYRNSGAAAISVLTDTAHFGGKIEDLVACKGAVDIPLLRKDFIIDESQLYQSRIAGADAVLLIIAALSDARYKGLLEATIALGMTPLTEIHDLGELKRILPFSPPLIGINNRNLHTLETDINVTKKLMEAIPDHVVTVSESGVHDAAQVDELLGHGVNGFLIGTSLMLAKDPAALLKEMCGI